MCATTLLWHHLVNACEVKARPDRIAGKTWRCLFLAAYPLCAKLVAAVLRDSVRAVSLLPCVADCCCTYCMLVRLSGSLNHIKGKIIIIIIIT